MIHLTDPNLYGL